MCCFPRPADEASFIFLGRASVVQRSFSDFPDVRMCSLFRCGGDKDGLLDLDLDHIEFHRMSPEGARRARGVRSPRYQGEGLNTKVEQIVLRNASLVNESFVNGKGGDRLV